MLGCLWRDGWVRGGLLGNGRLVVGGGRVSWVVESASRDIGGAMFFGGGCGGCCSIGTWWVQRCA